MRNLPLDAEKRRDLYGHTVLCPNRKTYSSLRLLSLGQKGFFVAEDEGFDGRFAFGANRKEQSASSCRLARLRRSLALDGFESRKTSEKKGNVRKVCHWFAMTRFSNSPIIPYFKMFCPSFFGKIGAHTAQPDYSPNSSAALAMREAISTPKGQRASQFWQPTHSEAWCSRRA